MFFEFRNIQCFDLWLRSNMDPEPSDWDGGPREVSCDEALVLPLFTREVSRWGHPSRHASGINPEGIPRSGRTGISDLLSPE